MGRDVHGARVVEQCVVSIHAPARGATFDRTHTLGAAQCFNPRARMGRDVMPSCWPARSGSFQSTRPHGARPEFDAACKKARAVSIHAPARRATCAPRRGWPCAGSFNPRSRTGRDDQAGGVGIATVVSIHAPARGRDAARDHAPLPNLVSIHAPARGATVQVRPGDAASGVSIHAPAQGATAARARACGAFWVSIHAPARGATAMKIPLDDIHEVSIHAPARGATGLAHALSPVTVFQSTRPHGARHLEITERAVAIRVSIHAPARGATT